MLTPSAGLVPAVDVLKRRTCQGKDDVGARHKTGHGASGGCSRGADAAGCALDGRG